MLLFFLHILSRCILFNIHSKFVEINISYITKIQEDQEEMSLYGITYCYKSATNLFILWLLLYTHAEAFLC